MIRQVGLIWLLAGSAAAAEPTPPAVETGVRLYDEGDFEAAASALESAALKAPAGAPRARAWLFVGLSRAALQDDAAARAAFRKALGEEPDIGPDRRRTPPHVLEMFDAVRAGLSARLLVLTAPGATVSLDGAPFGTTPFDGPAPIGRHRVEVRTPDRLREMPPADRVFRPDASVTLEAPLVLRQGTVTITSDPPGAVLYGPGDERLGQTPLADLRRPAGPLALRAELPPRPALLTEVRVDPDIPSKVDLTLPPLPGSPWYARASTWGWISAVAATGLAAGGGVVGWRARGAEDDIDRRAAASELDYDEWRRLSADAEDQALAANLIFGTAAALGLTAGALFLWGDE